MGKKADLDSPLSNNIKVLGGSIRGLGKTLKDLAPGSKEYTKV